MVKALPKNLVYLVIIMLYSCVNVRKATYFNDLSNESIAYSIENIEPDIQRNDLLSITVSSLNPEASEFFNVNNLSTETTASSGNIVKSTGYLVDKDGYIEFPMLGKIKAVGMNKKELKEYIAGNLVKKKILYDPIVTVRYLNYKVTVLGEVNHPSVFNVPNEKITLLEALGLAGDLSIYGKRDNILIIRDEQGKHVSHRINLNDKELFSSPYYNLKSNDVVYVSPNKSRVASSGQATLWLPVVLAALSLGIVVVDHVH